ncbi:MAG TPA: UDP-glucose 4-epimerase GalE [Thermomicrobiales bacterium]|nr:UDP-glucose 4-epimerase GalE [Thermomicrobiales bacterium]
MRILVTGGAGYIGSVAVELLAARGNDVVVLDNLWRGHAAAVPPGVETATADIRDADAVRRAVFAAEPDAVMHFAAATIVPESVADPATYFAINTVGSHNLLTAMNEAGVRKLVFSSTAAVYGVPETIPVTEDAPTLPINPYGYSKLMVEQMLACHAAAYGLRYVAFRYFNVAGATETHGEHHGPETHVIPVALLTLLGKRDRFKVFGTDYPTPDGTAIRDYVHVVDLAEAHLLALDKLDTCLGPLNLGSRDGFSVRQLVDAVERVTGRTLPVEYAPRREGDPPILVADSTRAQSLLGWQPRLSTPDEMIRSSWDWFQRNPGGYSD